VVLITHIIIIIKKPVREAKARIWAVVPLEEEVSIVIVFCQHSYCFVSSTRLGRKSNNYFGVLRL
jgi:hypothetical protein